MDFPADSVGLAAHCVDFAAHFEDYDENSQKDFRFYFACHSTFCL